MMKQFAPNYFADEDGNIYSTKSGEVRQLKPCKHRKKKGRSYFTLVVLAGGKRWSVGVAVLTAFVGPRPGPESQCRHLNDNQEDNRLVNLAWGSMAENVGDGILNGHHKLISYRMQGQKNHRAKITEDDVRQIRKLYSEGQTKRAISLQFGVSPHHIRRILCGWYWNHVV